MAVGSFSVLDPGFPGSFATRWVGIMKGLVGCFEFSIRAWLAAALVGALKQVLAAAFLIRQCDRVFAGEARGAQALARLAGGFDHAVFGNISQRVRTDGGRDLIHGSAVGDQLGTRSEVDAVEARPLHRWGG